MLVSPSTTMHLVLWTSDSVRRLTLCPGVLEVIKIQSEVSEDVQLILNPKGVSSAHIYTFYKTHR